MKTKHIYLVLCVAGAALPLWQVLPWLAEHGLNLELLFRELFSTRIGGFFGMDVMVSAAVLFVFVAAERRRTAIRCWWLPIPATLGVGVSLGLPLFLLLREISLEKGEDIGTI